MVAGLVAKQPSPCYVYFQLISPQQVIVCRMNLFFWWEDIKTMPSLQEGKGRSIANSNTTRHNLGLDIVPLLPSGISGTVSPRTPLQVDYDIQTLQTMLGHTDARTTMMYTHCIQSKTAKEAKGPLDL